jgi:hypothetical protein
MFAQRRQLAVGFADVSPICGNIRRSSANRRFGIIRKGFKRASYSAKLRGTAIALLKEWMEKFRLRIRKRETES